MDQLRTGIPGLDTILGGGLNRGTCYLVHGPPGAGKTILCNQIAFHLASQDRHALYFTLLSEAHDRMLQHMASMRFFEPGYIPDKLTYVSGYNALNEGGVSELTRLLLAEMRRRRAEFAVLDGLFAVHALASSEQDVRMFVHELQGHASITGCTILLLTNQSRSPSSPEHTMVDGWIELLDEMHAARAARSMIVRKQRGGAYLRGRHTFRIGDDGIIAFPRIEALLTRQPASSAATERLRTGIAGLDTMIGGGYPIGSVSMLLGPSGIGKTTIGLQFLAGCSTDERGLLFGFYETPARIRTKAQSIGINLDDLVKRGYLDIVWQSPAENLADEIGHRLLAAVERHKARRVFFDGISALKQSFLFPARLPVFLNAINNKLKTLDATVLYTLEIPELFMPTTLHTDDLSTIVDNVILLHYSMREELLRRKLTVLKIRDSDFDPMPEDFHITPTGVEFGPEPATSRRPGNSTEVGRGPGDSHPVRKEP